MAGKGSCGVPERWTTYIPLGRRMPGTRFIAFKVPLNESFNRNLLPEERFSPHDLIRMVEERKEELGLIIDLSYTTRYYSREELPSTVRYYKVLTRGREIPNRKTIQRFKYYVKKFLTANKDNDKLIGVHCTHGLNRTGYLICRYLIEVEGMEPNAAIELFNTCRGHSIERANYIEDLQKRALANCEVKNLGSDLSRSKGSAPAKPQKQLVKPPQHRPSQPPLAVPRKPGSGKKKQWPGPTAQEQPQELGHRHGALGQGQLQQKKLEQKQQKKLEQRQLKKLEHLEQRQQKKQGQQKWNHLEQDHLDQEKQMKQNHLEQRQQKKWNHLEQRQQKRWNHLEQRKQNHLEQHHLEQRKQKWNHLEQNHLQQRQQNHLEQRQQKKQNHLEQRKQNQLEQNHLEQRQQRKQNQLEQNHLEQRKQNHLEQNQLEQNHLEQRQQNHLEQRQPCSLAPRKCWLSPPSKKKHKELLPPQSPQPCLPQEPSAAKKRRHKKHRLGEQEMS